MISWLYSFSMCWMYAWFARTLNDDMIQCKVIVKKYLYGLAQDCSNSIANALELPQSCTKALIYSSQPWTLNFYILHFNALNILQILLIQIHDLVIHPVWDPFGLPQGPIVAPMSLCDRVAVKGWVCPSSHCHWVADPLHTHICGRGHYKGDNK